MHSIEIQNLTKRYGSQIVLDGINLMIEEGEFYALMGPNGSGKSTLSSIIATVTKYDSGSYAIYGKKPEQARDIIAYIPQENFSVPQLTGRENLLYFASILGISKRDAAQLVTQMLEIVGLTKDADKQFVNYSGGMKKRLELATALFPDVRILILDEPTTGLDPAARRDFFTLLKKIQNKQTSIFLITHYGQDAELASMVGLIHNGKIIAEGTPASLLAQHSLEETITFETPFLGNVYETILKKFSLEGKVAQLQNGYRIYTHDGGKILPDILNEFNQTGISATRTEMAKPTMEDVFFKLTEQSLQEITK